MKGRTIESIMTKKASKQPANVHGVLAEFSKSDDLISAVNQARNKGYRQMDAYSPFPVHGLTEALGHRESNLLVAVFIGGVIGALVGFVLQYYLSVIAYPYNIGGRPFNSWVSFIPIIFELCILFAAFTAVFGMIGRNGLPKPYHPVFKGAHFEAATRDKFFLCVEAQDESFDAQACKQFLIDLGSSYVEIIEP